MKCLRATLIECEAYYWDGTEETAALIRYGGMLDTPKWLDDAIKKRKITYDVNNKRTYLLIAVGDYIESLSGPGYIVYESDTQNIELVRKDVFEQHYKVI